MHFVILILKFDRQLHSNGREGKQRFETMKHAKLQDSYFE